MPLTAGAPNVGEVEIKNPFANSEGNIFRPPSRTRSEASFSEFHFDNSIHPPAGVCSARLQKHKAKQCNVKFYVSHMNEVIRMTPEQEYYAQFERIDGPRIDPAKVRGTAGDMSKHTKAKVTLLGHQEQEEKSAAIANGGKVKKSRGFILDISRKSPAACAPPPRSTDPLRPPEEIFRRAPKRSGYKIAESRWTWNESHEVTGQDPEFVKNHRPEVVLEGLGPVNRKLLTSIKGERKYMISGAQDMVPAATKPFATADCPPSARHIYENDKKHLCGFERGAQPKRCAQEGAVVEYLGESPEMWNCMSGQERPLDKWRSMSARAGQRNWMDSAESFYRDNDNGRSLAGQYPQTLNSASSPQILYSARSPARSLQSPGSSQFDAQYDTQVSNSQLDRTRRKEKDNRRSMLSTPSEAGSRASRASVTSSQQPRWR